MSAADRAFKSLNRQGGQFALLLDANFDIVWQSESMSMQGWDDLVGHNAVEHVHPDDLELVLQTMVEVQLTDDVHQAPDLAYAPESADVRLVDSHGVWRTYEVVTFNHLADPQINAVLCVGRLIRDRSDMAKAIELLGTGAEVDDVLPVIARLADHSVGGQTRASIARRHGPNTLSVTAAGEPPIDKRLADAAELVWTLGLTEPTIAGLDDPRLAHLADTARSAGFRVVFLLPIEAPASDEIIGAMAVWGRTTVDFQAGSQAPLHIALRLAALAIADHRTKRELRWAAAHDPLTGLVNRAEFARRLDALARDDVVLLYIDLDDFKPINDAYGHPVGDAVLIEVGQRIAQVIGPDDVVGRLGGDEFAVVCPATDDPLRGRFLADQIVSAIHRPIRHNGLNLSVGASVGVAIGAQPLIPALLMQQADEALYTAKNSGKNTVCLAG
ncbi:MAG: diguanylate cyclase [Ilumatobacteraceae bacterium]|nr:diguanylate cyclase [Ilumatobacteraceae bacterium]